MKQTQELLIDIKNQRQGHMDLIKISTAGSVDDGKSTLIGRLLFETNALKDDQLAHIEHVSAERGFNYLDLSLATDGLITEREQGITVDVSHIYLNTPNRRYILADSPGHEEYTRNMVTGSSSAQAMLILLDARKGITTQTRRHFFIASLLEISQIIVCINKMDLVAYDKSVFDSIQRDFSQMAKQVNNSGQHVHYMPISALLGDNISKKSDKMTWYNGKPLLELMDSLHAGMAKQREAFFQIQHVLLNKDNNEFGTRGLTGKLHGGSLSIGEDVHVLPGDTHTKIRRIHIYGKDIETLHAGENGTIELENEVDAARGSYILPKNHSFETVNTCTAKVCWMVKNPLIRGNKYIIQQGPRRVQARVLDVEYGIHLEKFEQKEVESLGLNDIGSVVWQFAEPLSVGSYGDHKQAGAFIIIDARDYNTVGVGFIDLKSAAD